MSFGRSSEKGPQESSFEREARAGLADLPVVVDPIRPRRTKKQTPEKSSKTDKDPTPENTSRRKQLSIGLASAAVFGFIAGPHIPEAIENAENLVRGQYNEAASAYLSAHLSAIPVEASIEASADMQWILNQGAPNLYPPIKMLEADGSEVIRHPQMFFRLEDGATAVFFVTPREGELQPLTVRERLGKPTVYVDLNSYQLGTAYHLADGSRVPFEPLPFTQLNDNMSPEALGALSAAQADPKTMQGAVQEFQVAVSQGIAGEAGEMSKFSPQEKDLQEAVKAAITRAINEQILNPEVGITEPGSEASVNFSGRIHVYAPENPGLSSVLDFPTDSVGVSKFEVIVPTEGTE